MELVRNNNDCQEGSSKKAKTTCDQLDFIRNLPDDILVHILSFLPLKDAIATVFLRRFSNLWRQTQVLDFCGCVHPAFNFRKLIPGLLDVLESDSLDRLSFKFDDNETNAEWEKGVRDHLEMLITYALRKQVKVMELDLTRNGEEVIHRDECYDFPDVLISEYLTHLTLSACKMKLCMTTRLKALKVMTLEQVTLTDEVMGKILAGCPSLEDVSLINCYGLKRLVCENPNLERVKLTMTFKESDSLVISCPHPISLDIDVRAERASLLSASSADISIFFTRFGCSRHVVRRLMEELSKCKTFRPCLWTILVFSVWNLRNMERFPPFGWKNLVLKLCLIKWHHHGLSLLLRNCPSLETLTMSFYPKHHAAKRISQEVTWNNTHAFDLDKFWVAQELASFPLLTTVTINGLMNEPYVVDIVAFLLRSASTLQKLVISAQNLPKLTGQETSCILFSSRKNQNSKRYATEILPDLLQKFESLPKASPGVVITLS